MCMQMVLKCADIGHLAVDSKTHKQWAYQLEEEFFRQVLLVRSHLGTEAFLADLTHAFVTK